MVCFVSVGVACSEYTAAALDAAAAYAAAAAHAAAAAVVCAATCRSMLRLSLLLPRQWRSCPAESRTFSLVRYSYPSPSPSGIICCHMKWHYSA